MAAEKGIQVSLWMSCLIGYTISSPCPYSHMYICPNHIKILNELIQFYMQINIQVYVCYNNNCKG